MRISDRAATTTLFTSLTIAGWAQKGDESAKASPVSLKAAAKEARESSEALADNAGHENIGQDAR